MSRINPVDPETIEPETARSLAAVRKKLGVLPNLFTTIAHSPVALDSYLKLMETLSLGRLSSKQRELIAIAVAQHNSCGYCLSAHAALGAGVGLSKMDIEHARSGSARHPVDNVIIDFALKVLDARGAVSNEDLASIRKSGADDGIVVEILANVVLNILTNYLNRLAETAIDFPIISLDSVA